MSQNEFNEHLDVTSDRTIQGAVNGGATVRNGAVLVVQGLVRGPVTVEAGAAINLYGMFAGEIQENLGAIMVAGLLDLELGSGHGNIAVSVGSMVTGSSNPLVLGADGALKPVESGGGDFNISPDSAGRYFIYDAEQNQFVALTGE